MTCPRCHGERDIAYVNNGNVSPTYPCPECCPSAAAVGDKMREALEEIVRVGKWTGTDGVEYTSGEGRLAEEALAATPPSRPVTAGAPVMWIHLIDVEGEKRIRAWTADPVRAQWFHDVEKIDMTPLYAAATPAAETDADLPTFQDVRGILPPPAAAGREDDLYRRIEMPDGHVRYEPVALSPHKLGPWPKEEIEPGRFVDVDPEVLRRAAIGHPQYSAALEAALATPPAPGADRASVIEECARELETSYPDHAWLNAACAAIRALAPKGAA